MMPLPKSRIVSVAIAACILALSIALLGLTCATVHYNNVQSAENGYFLVEFRDYNGSGINATWENRIAYNAVEKDMSDTYALLSGSIVAAIIAMAVGILTAWSTPFEYALPLPKQKTRTINLTGPSAILTLDVCLATLLLIIACYTWVRSVQGAWGINIYDMPNRPLDYTVQSLPRRTYSTFELTICALVWLVEPGGTASPFGELRGQCQNATASRYIVMAILALALLRLLLRPLAHFLRPLKEFREWRRHKHAMREGKTLESHGTGIKGTDDLESEDSSERGRRRKSEQEDPHRFVAELPGCQLTRVEADEDVALREMPGAGGGGEEMDAGVAAVEKDAGSKT